jgi:hypothetical protein
VSDREKYDLRGPVAGIRTEHWTCDPQAGEISEKPSYATVIAHDVEGRVTSTRHENAEGRVLRIVPNASGLSRVVARRPKKRRK